MYEEYDIIVVLDRNSACFNEEEFSSRRMPRQTLSDCLDLYNVESTVSSSSPPLLSPSNKPLLLFTGEWTGESPPSIPIFKKQFYIPYLKLASSAKNIALVAMSASKLNTFLLFDCEARSISSANEIYTLILDKLFPWRPTVAEEAFVRRGAAAVQRDVRHTLSSISSLLLLPTAAHTSGTAASQLGLSSPSTSLPRASRALAMSSAGTSLGFQPQFAFPPQSDCHVKPLPSAEQGLRVYEFFSGIGGMHAALPDTIRGLPIAEITAFDCSAVANQVYAHNYIRPESVLSRGRKCVLREVLIDGLKTHQLDGGSAADVWTMSPPCQPYTTTKGAHQLGSRDNRNKALFHLMQLLLDLKVKPRWIFLENVSAFQRSDVADLLRRVLRHCGYSFHEYSLSPAAVGIPNLRMRYYLAAEYGSRLRTGEGEVQTRLACCGESDEAVPCHSLDRYIIEENRIPPDVRSELLLSEATLGACWAARRISVVGRHDRTTFCFTKGYGRQIDRSTGSCYLPGTRGPLASAEYTLDRSDMTAFHGRLRLFHPDELLAIAGFPLEFKFPPTLPIKKQFACIGNSINVTVVRAVMSELFTTSSIPSTCLRAVPDTMTS